MEGLLELAFPPRCGRDAIETHAGAGSLAEGVLCSAVPDFARFRATLKEKKTRAPQFLTHKKFPALPLALQAEDAVLPPPPTLPPPFQPPSSAPEEVSNSDLDLGIIVGPLLIGVILCSYIIYVFARRRRLLQEIHMIPESSSECSTVSASSRGAQSNGDNDSIRLMPNTRRS